MKKSVIGSALLVAGILASFAGQAEEQPLIEAVEYERLIVNWSPNDQRLATLLAYEDGTKAPKRLLIRQDTELENEHGESLPIEHLKARIDWDGTVQTLSSNPGVAIKILLH